MPREAHLAGSRPPPRALAGRWLLALLAGLLLVPLAAPTGSAQTKKKPATKKERIRQLRARLNRLSTEKREQRQELRETKKQQARLADRLNTSYQRLEDANAALARSATRLRDAEVAVARANRQLAEAEERLRQQRQRFGKRIAFYYRQGTVEYLDVLLGSADLSDFLDRKYYVDRIVGQDALILGELKEAEAEVARRREILLRDREVLAEAHRENQDLVIRVAAETTEMEKLNRYLRNERVAQEERLRELEEDSNEIQRNLEAELARRLANPGSYRNLPPWTGNFARPVNGAVTSGFGYRFHPILRTQRLHTGIDFGASKGTPVHAAADGEVFSASWRGGYGKCIILLHGGGVSTLYGHLSVIHVGAGQTVRRGQLIGAVGSTGLSTGPHLHFEVRRNGVPVNPR